MRECERDNDEKDEKNPRYEAVLKVIETPKASN